MENNNFSIDRKISEQLSKGTRIYRIIYGVTLMIIGLIMFSRTGFSILLATSFLAEALILTGIISIIYGVKGKELFRQRYRLKMDSVSLRIKKSFESELIINLNLITHLKGLPLGLEICFDDYVKTYDFSWMTTQEFKDFHRKISDYCIKNKIETE